MNKDGLYHQPRWVNAIVVVAVVPIVLSQFVMPTGLARLISVGLSLCIFLFVGICNKLRSGAVFPRWAEAASLSDRLKTENARRITKTELAIVAADVSADDVQPGSLQSLAGAVQHIAANLQITIRENWLKPGNSRSNEAIEFSYRKTIVQVEIRNSNYCCSAYDAARPTKRSEWSEQRTSTLAWIIAGHPFDSEAFRRVYFSMPN